MEEEVQVTCTPAAISGGSGGGGTNLFSSYPGIDSNGNTPPVSPPQGNNGGAIPGTGTSPAYGASGGGGATVKGNGTSGGQAGAGGAGATTSIMEVAVTRAGGGGSQFEPTGGKCRSRWFRWKVELVVEDVVIHANAATNRGGGGGGAEDGPVKMVETGGSGIVIIRYKFQ